MEPKELRLLTTEQAAEALGISLEGIYRSIICKRLTPVTRIGRRVYLDAEVIASYKARKEAKRGK
jgi:excisionase family DNA binding protein